MSPIDHFALPKLPERDPRGHKGTFGTVVIIGGCCSTGRRMVGAPALCATAALRSGAGLAKLVVPAPIMNAAIIICPSATGIPVPVDETGEMIGSDAAAVLDDHFQTAHAIVVGPGFGSGESVKAAAVRCIQQEHCPVIVDADAINALAEVPELWRDFRAAAVLTPHPGEFARLAESLNIEADPVNEERRPAAAEALAQRIGCIVVLKGAGTIVSDGQRTWRNTTGGSMLGTAGTGDVLSGLIAGLAAQFTGIGTRKSPTRPLDLFDVARISVCAHGLAGERWATQAKADAGLIAMELTELLPAVLAQL